MHKSHSLGAILLLSTLILSCSSQKILFEVLDTNSYLPRATVTAFVPQAINQNNLVNASLAGQVVNMAIALDNANTFIVTSDEQYCTPAFNITPCNSPCSLSNVSVYEFDYPFFQVQPAYTVNQNITIGSVWSSNTVYGVNDCNLWNFGSTAFSTGNLGVNNTPNGIIGLAAPTNNASNFFLNSTTSFMIYFSSYTSGEIDFSGMNSALYYTQQVTIPVNSNWWISAYGVSLNKNINSLVGISYIVPDLNFQGIAVPYNVWESIYDTLYSYGWDCDETYSTVYGVFPTCSNSGSVSSYNLPDILFSNTSTNVMFSLPASAYISQTSDGQYFIFIAQTTTGTPSYSYQVEVSSAYSNSVIVGAAFLNYYTAFFDFSNASQNYLTFSVAYNSATLSIVIIVVSSLCCLGCCGAFIGLYCCCKNKQRNFIGGGAGPVRPPVQVNEYQMTTFNNGQPIYGNSVGNFGQPLMAGQLPVYNQPMAVNPGYVQNPGFVQPGYVQTGFVQPNYVQPTFVQPNYEQQTVVVQPGFGGPVVEQVYVQGGNVF